MNLNFITYQLIIKSIDQDTIGNDFIRHHRYNSCSLFRREGGIAYIHVYMNNYKKHTMYVHNFLNTQIVKILIYQNAFKQNSATI